MTTVLVTGSTGQLGRPTTAVLRATGYEVRGLTRSGGDGSVTADLVTGAGLDEAFAGAEAVVHLATTNGQRDVDMASNLVAAARRAGVAHLVLISIVGIDEIPRDFYRDRVVIEEIARASGLGLTIQRATQFHSFVDRIVSSQRFSPVLVTPRSRFQPIATADVGHRLAELVAAGPQGRADDIGGPAQRTITDLHAAWKRATGSRRHIWAPHLPGKALGAYDTGANLVPGPPYGHGTFEEYLRETYP